MHLYIVQDIQHPSQVFIWPLSFFTCKFIVLLNSIWFLHRKNSKMHLYLLPHNLCKVTTNTILLLCNTRTLHVKYETI